MADRLLGELIIHTKSANAGPPGAMSLESVLMIQSPDNGKMRLTGVVTVLDVPAARKIVLFDSRSNRAIKQTMSDPDTGVYEFNYIRDGEYTVMAFDHTGTYDPEAKTTLSPEPM